VLKEVVEGKRPLGLILLLFLKSKKELLTGKNGSNKLKQRKYFKTSSTNKGIKDPLKKRNLIAARKSLRLLLNESGQEELAAWIKSYTAKNEYAFGSNYILNLMITYIQ
jgi:hypothetical protein